MKIRAGLAALALAPPLVFADVPWVGPDCLISWDANPSIEMVQGYRVYIEGGPAGNVNMAVTDVGSATQSTCQNANVTQGFNTVSVSAYNPVGESERSVSVPFAYATSAPGTPTGPNRPAGLRVEAWATPEP